MNKLKLYGFITSLFLLLVFAGCGPVGKVPLNVAPTSTPTPAPILKEAPLGLAPPACVPEEVSIDRVTSFCANQGLGLGGASFLYHPNMSNLNFQTGDITCDYSSDSPPNKVTCWGPQNETFEETDCTACRPPDAPESYGTYSCADGFMKDNNGHCVAIDPAKDYPLCPPESHYSNDLQKCVDDGTGKPIALCPDGFPYFIADGQYCLAKPYPQVFNCQTFTVQLGDCSVSPNPPGGGNQGNGGSQLSCPADTNWDAGKSCCVNADHRCQ